MSDANITKQVLADSLKKLMKAGPFAKISVIDICDGCGMNRKSFYYHFKDKYDLVNWIFYTDFIRVVSRQVYTNGWELLTAVVELFAGDRDFYRRALQIEGQNSFRDYFFEATEPIFSMFMKELALSEESEQLNIHYMSDCFLIMIYRWLDGDKRTSPEEFIANLQQLLRAIGRTIPE